MVDVTEVVLVRHAQPDWEPDGRAVDHPALTPLGREQARRAAEVLAKEHFDHFYASPLRRVVETAEPIAETLGMAPRQVTWLEELHLPKMEGKTVEEVEEFFGLARARDLELHWNGMPGGESFRHFYERVSSGVEDLLTASHGMQVHQSSGHRIWRVPHVAERVLIVAHEGTNAVILSHLLGIDPVPWASLRFSSGWAGISRVHTIPVASGHIWALDSFNARQHLDGIGDG
ncbi:MAG: histidine phosphatase family protein [Myxococcota bacterium]